MRMAQIAALIAPAHVIDGGVRPLQLHLEGSHEGIFRHHRHAVTRAGDVDANGELVGQPVPPLRQRIRSESWRSRGAAALMLTQLRQAVHSAAQRRRGLRGSWRLAKPKPPLSDRRQPPGVISGGTGSQMTELALTILSSPADAAVIERFTSARSDWSRRNAFGFARGASTWSISRSRHGSVPSWSAPRG